MPIDTSIADMPWLLHPANPGASLAQGVEAGSRIAANYLQGVGLAQRTMEAERQANMQQQELNAKLALAPLQQTLLQQQADKGALTIEQMLRAKQDDLEADKAFTGLQGAIFDKLNTGDLNGAVMEYAKGIAQHPTLALVDKYKALGGQLETMKKEADRADYFKSVTEERRFKDMPPAARFEELARQAEAEGDSETAANYREHAGLEVQREERLQKQQEDVHQHNQIRLEQLKANIARTSNKAALDAFNSRLRNIENAPRLKLPERNAKVSELLKEYEDKYGVSAPVAPAVPAAAPAPATAAPATRFTPGTVYRDKYGNQREYQADGTWKVLPQ